MHYTEKKASIFVVVAWKIAKHAGYSGIVGPCPNYTQGDHRCLKHNQDNSLALNSNKTP